MNRTQTLNQVIADSGWTDVRRRGQYTDLQRGSETASFQRVYPHNGDMRVLNAFVNGQPVKGFDGLVAALSKEA